MFPYGHNGAFVSLPLRNSYLFGSISYSTFLILFNSGFIVPCFGLALPLTFWVLPKAGKSKHKSSIEILLLNLAQMFHRSTSAAILPNRCACCTTQIYKNLYKNWIFRKFKYARKEEFYAPIICFG